MRYQSNVPGFEHCFVEISERWTRGDVKNFFALKGEDYLTLVRSKIVAIYLETSSIHSATIPTLNGTSIDILRLNPEAIDSADKLTSEAADNVDYQLWRWFSVALQKGVDDLYALGEATARRWLDGSVN